MIKLRKTRNRNKKFYDAISHAHLHNLVKMCGLQANVDLLPLKNRIKNARSILEVGAGYGRVIDFMRAVNPSAKIDTIEYSHALCATLRSQYNDTVAIIETDLTKIKPKTLGKYSLITWMWGSIIDIDPTQRLKFLKKIYRALRVGGTIIIDVPVCDTTEWDDRKSTIIDYMHKNIGEIHCFDVPTLSEMEFYKRKLKASALDTVPYSTEIQNDTGGISYSARCLYCFKKINNK